MRRLRRVVRLALTVLTLVCMGSPPPLAEEPIPPELRDIGIDAQLGTRVPLDLTFNNESGQQTPLSTYFHQDKPVVFLFVYYECPMLCTLVLNSLTATLKQMAWAPGQQFEVVALSINPRETPALAQAKKENYLKDFGRPEAASGMHFLTGEEAKIQKLAATLGFKYKYDEKQQQYAHGAGIYVLTPQGELSQVLYGIDYPERTLRLALVEASQGKVGSVLDKLALFCYHYDPQTNSYTLMATRVMQLGGALTVLILGTALGGLFVRERRRARASQAAAPPTPEEPGRPVAPDASPIPRA